MSNITWYMIIAAISVLITAFAMYMKKDIYTLSTLLPFYLFSAAITWIGEFIVLGLFDSYAYMTGVFQDPWAQNLLAHLILNTTMFPAVSTVMIAYSLGYGYMVLVSVIFVLAEYLFVQLGIYEQHWWRYYISTINVIAFLLIAKKWFYKMQKHPVGSTRAIIFYFIAMLLIHTTTPILLLLGKQHFNIGFVNSLVDNFYRSSTIFAFAYHLIDSLVLTFFVCVQKKWYWKAMSFVFSITVYSILLKAHILVINNGWKFIYTLLIQEACVAAYILLEKYTWKRN